MVLSCTQLLVWSCEFDARRFQAAPPSTNSRTLSVLPLHIRQNKGTGAWLKLPAHCDGCSATLLQNNAPWLDWPFLCCTEETSYIVCATGIVTHYSNVLHVACLQQACTSWRRISLLVFCLCIVAFINALKRLFRRQLMTRSDSYCNSTWHFVDDYTTALQIPSRLFVQVPER